MNNPTLSIGNSMTQVSGITPEQLRQLREVLSFEPEQARSYFLPGVPIRRKYLIDLKGRFPSGLVPRVLEWGKSAHVYLTCVRTTKPPVPYVTRNLILPYVPYKAQLEAKAAALHHGRGTIVMPTGTGKAAVIAMLAEAFKVKILVVVPTLELKKQLTASLQEALSGESMPTVENIDSAALKTLKGFDCLIIDEAHHVAAQTFQKLNKTAWTGIYHRFFLTATPFRTTEGEQMLFEGIAGNVIYRLPFNTAVKAGHIVPIEAYYFTTPRQQTTAKTWADVYRTLVVHNTPRNIQIKHVLMNLVQADKSTLCLVKEIAHGEILSELTGIPFVNGQDEASREYLSQFKSGRLKGLIGTEGVVGEGVDTKPCEYVIIAGLGKARGAFMQKCGRAVRTYPGKESAKVILIRDASHKFCSRHFKEQCKILKEEYGVDAQEI